MSIEEFAKDLQKHPVVGVDINCLPRNLDDELILGISGSADKECLPCFFGLQLALAISFSGHPNSAPSMRLIFDQCEGKQYLLRPLKQLAKEQQQQRVGLEMMQMQIRGELFDKFCVVVGSNKNGLFVPLNSQELNVREASGKTRSVLIPKDSTIEDLLCVLRGWKGIPKSFRLVSSEVDKTLSPESIIRFLNFKPGAVVHVVPQFATNGGCCCSIGGNDWRNSWAFETSPHLLLKQILKNMFCTPVPDSIEKCHWLPILFRKNVEMSHWHLRCSNPDARVLWSQDNEHRWPKTFRKIVYMLTFIQFGENKAMFLPQEVAFSIAEFL